MTSAITCCEERLRRFCECDAYWWYDYWGGVLTRNRPNSILLDREVLATNTAMNARMKRDAWKKHCGTELPELAQIPQDCDLLSVTKSEYEDLRKVLTGLYRRLTSAPGLRDMAVSKVMYLKRPGLIAISDSYSRKVLGVPESVSDDAARGLAVIHEARNVALRNAETLRRLRAWSRENLKYSGRPDHFGNIRADDIPVGTPVEMTEIRVLDVFVWSELAIRGGHEKWQQWAAEHAPVCRRSVTLTL